MTKGLLISIKNKQKLYRNFFLKGTAFGKHFYKACANKLTRVKNLSKKIHYTEFISKNKSNPKKMWEIINSSITTKGVISPLTKINIENSVIEDSSKIADCFYQFLLKFVTLSLTMSINPYIHITFLILKKPCFTFFSSRSLHCN